MRERTTDAVGVQEESAKDVLTEILRDGAHKMLATAIESEVDAYIDAYADQRDAHGHRLVVRNGHKDERQIQTGIGPVTVCQPRVDDQRIDENGKRIRFASKILPPYLRKTKSIEELILLPRALPTPGSDKALESSGAASLGARFTPRWYSQRRV